MLNFHDFNEASHGGSQVNWYPFQWQEVQLVDTVSLFLKWYDDDTSD